VPCTKKERSDQPCHGIPLSCGAWRINAIRTTRRSAGRKHLGLASAEKLSGLRREHVDWFSCTRFE
jgi:hypothetical protein